MTLLMSRRTALAAGIAAIVAGAPSAFAQVRLHVRGTIEKLDGSMLTIRSREGAEVVVKLADNFVVQAVVKRSLSDIKVGDYVGVVGLPQADGSARALEVHIFPAAMRGVAEGHSTWDLMPNSTMTNATVTELVAKVDTHSLTVKYKDGEKTFTVPPECPIVTYVPGDRSDLKPGASVFLGAVVRQTEGGALTTTRVAVGRGIVPPM